MHQYLTPFPDSCTGFTQSHYKQRPSGVSVPELRFREGSPLSRKYRVVCRKCNQGWMRQELEEKTAPLLKPMMLNSPRLLLRPDQQQLASWGVKMGMMFEYTSYNITTNPRQKHQFYRTLRPPDFTEVWLGRYTGGRDRWVYQVASRLITTDDNSMEQPDRFNTMTTTLLCSGVVMNLTITDAGTGPNPLHLGRYPVSRDLVRLWPQSTHWYCGRLQQL